jgi:hypothetical protein
MTRHPFTRLPSLPPLPPLVRPLRHHATPASLPPAAAASRTRTATSWRWQRAGWRRASPRCMPPCLTATAAPPRQSGSPTTCWATWRSTGRAPTHRRKPSARRSSRQTRWAGQGWLGVRRWAHGCGQLGVRRRVQAAGIVRRAAASHEHQPFPPAPGLHKLPVRAVPGPAVHQLRLRVSRPPHAGHPGPQGRLHGHGW